MSIEVESNELSSSLFADRIETFGSLLIRALFQKNLLHGTLQAVTEYFEIVDQSDNDELYFMEKFRGAAFLSKIDQIQNNRPSVVDLLRGSPLVEIIKKYFNEEIGIVNRQSRIRRMKSDNIEHSLPAHQDIVVFDTRTAFTLWIPLVDTGEDTPGLSVFLENVDTAIEHSLEKSDGRYAEIELDEYYVESSKWLKPVVRAGDAMIFPPTTVHRTFVPEKVTKDRYSCEFRLVPKSCFGMKRYLGDITEV